MKPSEIINMPEVRLLTDLMDLDVPKETLLISDYEFVEDCIVIREILVLNVDGEFLRAANLKRVEPYLSSMRVKFSNK